MSYTHTFLLSISRTGRDLAETMEQPYTQEMAHNDNQVHDMQLHK